MNCQRRKSTTLERELYASKMPSELIKFSQLFHCSSFECRFSSEMLNIADNHKSPKWLFMEKKREKSAGQFASLSKSIKARKETNLRQPLNVIDSIAWWKNLPSTATLTRRKFFDFSLTVITLELFYIHQTSTPIPIPLIRWLILSFLMGMWRDAESIFVSFIRSLKLPTEDEEEIALIINETSIFLLSLN